MDSESRLSGSRLQFKEEIQIPVPWGHLAAKVWGPDDGVPVLALHGWLDNAGTFDPIAPLLPANIRLVCLDFCGHGLSSPYPPGMFLNYYDHIYHIKLVIEHFKWNKVTIIGHSMGGFAGIMFTSMFPELVEKLVSIDAVKQYSPPAETLSPRMKGVLTQFHELCKKLDKGIPEKGMTWDEARDRLVKSYGGSIDEKDAEVLMVRGVRRREGKDNVYEYTRDLRNIVRPYLFMDLTNEQHKAMAREITVPFLLIKAKNTYTFEAQEIYREFYDIYRDASEDFRFVAIEGRHHVHLSEPDLVAPHINNFLFPPVQSKL